MSNSDERIERVAKAIYETTDQPGYSWADIKREWPGDERAIKLMARAALDALGEQDKATGEDGTVEAALTAPSLVGRDEDNTGGVA